MLEKKRIEVKLCKIDKKLELTQTTSTLEYLVCLITKTLEFPPKHVYFPLIIFDYKGRVFANKK